ncbi:unnamed protein product [Auanema sp. JU1783]|nr:unnamed protein product [Auanema sp. JU1783]
MGDELEKVRAEAVRLAASLEEATADKIKAAEYGMLLLEEKQELQQKLKILEEQYEAAKDEVEQANQLLVEFRTQHKVATKTELENEQSLLEESSRKEQELLNHISKLESDLRNTEQELNRSKSELERLQTEHASASESGHQLDEERRKLRAELKEVKEREQRIMADFTELEEENINLQSTVANLRGAQTEFEALKLTCSRYLDEIYMLNSAVQESETLKNIADKQVEEALLTAQQEREQRLAMKRELEAAKNAEHLNSLADMLHGLERLGEEGGSLPQPSNDLFSELQGTADGKVKELEALNENLTEKVKEREKASIDLIISLMNQLNINHSGDLDFIHARQQKDVVIDKIEQLLKGSNVDSSVEKKVHTQKNDIRTLLLLAGEKNAMLAATQDAMIQLSDQLYQFYHQLVQNHGLTCDKSVMEVVHKLRQLAKDNAEDTPRLSLADEGVECGSEAETGTRAIPFQADRVMLAPSFIKDVDAKLNSCKVNQVASDTDLRQRVLTDGSAVSETTDSMKKLLTSVKRATEQALNQAVASTGDNEEIIMQNMKLRSQLSTKRDQISTLRTVLKSNKLTAESALASLKEKYESEKKTNQELAEKQRKELKQLKEDAATFASHRAMFTARCEELQAQVEEYKAELKASEDEKKTLNQLLRLAIHQKLALNQRLEDVEIDRDSRQALKRTNNKATTSSRDAFQPKAGRGEEREQLDKGGSHCPSASFTSRDLDNALPPDDPHRSEPLSRIEAEKRITTAIAELRAQLEAPRLFAGTELVVLFLSIPVVMIYLAVLMRQIDPIF